MRHIAPAALDVPEVRAHDVQAAQQGERLVRGVHEGGPVADLREQASAMREEAARSKRNDRERQRCYSAKSRAKKSQK